MEVSGGVFILGWPPLNIICLPHNLCINVLVPRVRILNIASSHIRETSMLRVASHLEQREATAIATS